MDFYRTGTMLSSYFNSIKRKSTAVLRPEDFFPFLGRVTRKVQSADEIEKVLRLHAAIINRRYDKWQEEKKS